MGDVRGRDRLSPRTHGHHLRASHGTRRVGKGPARVLQAWQDAGEWPDQGVRHTFEESRDIPERAAGLRLRPRAHVPRAARDAALQSRAGQGIPDPPQRRRPIQPDVPFGIPRARLRYPLHVARPHRPDPRHRCARPGHPRRGLGVDRNAARAHPPTSQAGMGHHARGGHRTDELVVPRTARRRAVEPGRVRVQRQRAHRRRLRNTRSMGGQWVNRGLLCKIYPCIDPRDRADADIAS